MRYGRRSDHECFARKSTMKFRRKAAGVVEAPLNEGSLNLLADCELAASVAGGPFKFTVTSPYMLARTLLDRHYGAFDELVMAIAGVLAHLSPEGTVYVTERAETSLPQVYVGNNQYTGEPIYAPTRHELGDTKCRTITYTLVGHTRYKEYFPASYTPAFRALYKMLVPAALARSTHVFTVSDSERDSILWRAVSLLRRSCRASSALRPVSLWRISRNES